MASKPIEEMTQEEKLAELQSYGIDPFASSVELKPIEEMTQEEKLAELESYGIGGDPTFKESFARSALGLTQSVLGVAPQVGAQLVEDIQGKDFDPITDFGQEESYSNRLKEFGRNVVRDTEEKLSQIKKDKTTFRDVEEAYDKADGIAEGVLEALPVFGQYAKETFAEQAAPFGAFAGSYAAGNLITRGAALAAGSALGPVLGPIAGVATALGAFYLPNYAGEVAQERKEDEGEDYVLETEDTVNDLKYALPASALAFLSDRLLLGFTPTAKLLGGGGLYSKVAVDAATGATVESLTEVGERITQRAALGKSLDDEEAVEEYREIGIASGLFGSGTKALSSVGEYYLDADRNAARQNLVDTVFNEGKKDNIIKDVYESGQLDIPGLAPVSEKETQRQRLVEALQKAKQKDEEIQSITSLNAVAKAQEDLDNFDIKQSKTALGEKETQLKLFPSEKVDQKSLDPSVKLRDTLRKKAKKLEEQRKKQNKKKVSKANKMQLATPAVWKYLEETNLYGGGEEFIQILESGRYTGSISGSNGRVSLDDFKAFLTESTGVGEKTLDQTEIDKKPEIKSEIETEVDTRSNEDLANLFDERFNIDADTETVGTTEADADVEVEILDTNDPITKAREKARQDMKDSVVFDYQKENMANIIGKNLGPEAKEAYTEEAKKIAKENVEQFQRDRAAAEIDPRQVDADTPKFDLVPPKPVAYANDPNNVEPFVDRQLAAMNAGTYSEFMANLSDEDQQLANNFTDRIEQLLEQKQRQESDLEAARKDQLDLFPSEDVDEWADYEASVKDDIKTSIEENVPASLGDQTRARQEKDPNNLNNFPDNFDYFVTLPANIFSTNETTASIRDRKKVEDYLKILQENNPNNLYFIEELGNAVVITHRPRNLKEVLKVDSVFHQTDINGLRGILLETRTRTPFLRKEVYVSPDINLALGQPANVRSDRASKFILEFDTEKISGKVPNNVANRGLDALSEGETYEVIIRNSGISQPLEESKKIIKNIYVQSDNKKSIENIQKDLPRKFIRRQNKAYQSALNNFDFDNIESVSFEGKGNFYKIPLKQEDIKTSIEPSAKTLNFQLQELGITPKNVTKKLQELNKAGYNISLSDKETRTGLFSNTTKEKIIKAEKNKREKNKEKEDATNDLKSRIDTYRTRSFANKANVPLADLLQDPYSKNYIDPRFFSSTEVDTAQYKSNLNKLKQDFFNNKITQNEYDQKRIELDKQLGRLPAPLNGLSTDEVIAFIREGENNKDGAGTYTAIENIAGKEAALRHLAGDIATSNITNSSLNSNNAINIVNEKTTNFGPKGVGKNVDEAISLFFPYTGSKIGQTYYNNLTDVEKNIVIQIAKEYKKALPRNVKGTYKKFNNQANNRIARLEKKLSRHNKAVENSRKAEENFNAGKISRDNYENIIKQNAKQIQRSTSYIDETGKRIETLYEDTAQKEINELKEQSKFISDTLRQTEVEETQLENELKELSSKLNEYKKDSNEYNSLLKKIQTKEESLATLQTDTINRLDNINKDIFNELETFAEGSTTFVYTQEEQNFIRKYFNDPKIGFVQKVRNFSENIAKEINAQYISTLRKRIDIVNKNFEEGKISAEQKSTLISYFKYSGNQISEIQGISVNTKLFEDVREAFVNLITAKEENNIRNDVFIRLLQALTPQLIVNSPISYAPINLMDTLIEPYANSLNKSEFDAFIAEQENQKITNRKLVREGTNALKNLYKSKQKVPTNKEKTLNKLQKLLNISALEIENRITILESPEQSGIENLNSRAGGAVVNGRAYLFTNNISEGNEISTFMHEVGVHVGMFKLLGGNFKQLSSRITSFYSKNIYDGSAEKVIATRAYERLKYANSVAGEKSKINLNSTLQQEELVAYFVEEAVRFGINPLATKNAKNFANSENLKNWFKQFIDSAITAIKRIFNIEISIDKDSGGYKVDYVVDENGRVRTEATTRNAKGEFIKAPDADLNADDIVNLAYGAAKLGMVDESGLFFKVDKDNPKNSKFILKGTKYSIVNNNLKLNIPSEGLNAGKNVLDAIGKSKEELLPVWDQNFADGIAGKLLQAPNWLRRGYYGLLSLPQLADTVRRSSPSLANALEELNNASAKKRRLIEDQRGRFRDAIIKIKLLQEKESEKDIIKFNRITNKSSIADENGKRYDLREYFKSNPNPEVVNSDLYKEFLTLPDTLKAAYKIVVDEYENAGKVYREALLNMMTDASSQENVKVVSELKAELADPNTLGTRRSEIVDQLDKIDAKILSDKQKITNAMFTKGEITPFIPLVRRGSYWLKEEGEPDTSPSYAFETRREAEKFKKAFSKKYPNVKFVADAEGNTVFQKIGNENIIYGDFQTTGYLPQIMTTIRKQLGKQPNDPANVKITSILNEVQELYLASQPRESLIQQFRKRREVPGFEEDVLQNFSHMGMKYANQIAMLQANPEINNAYGKIKNIIAPEGRTFNDQFTSVVDTIQGRKSFLLDPTPASWAAKGAYLGYAWYILGNISSAIVNLTHLALVAYPALAAEYGPVKAFGAMMDAFKFYAAGGRDNNTDLVFFGYRDKGLRSRLSLRDRTMFAFGDKNTKISKSMTPEFLRKYGFTQQEMQELYDTSIDRSTIRRSSAQELQDIRRGSVDQFTGAYSKAELGLGWVFQNSERLLREVQTLASYKLAKEKYGKTATREQLITRTTTFVDEVNGPALSETGPEFLQDNFGRFFGVFKKFAFAMIYYQWKLFRDAFTPLGKDAQGQDIQRNPNLPADMPSVRDLARRQLFASFVPAIMFAGVRGMPYFGLITLLGDLFRDEEEDGQTDMIVRQAVGDIMYRGPFSHYLNVDFASRTGFYALAFRDDPYRRSEIGNLAFTLESLAGPVYSIARSPERALNYYNKGETEKAIETVLPSFIRNPLKAIRYGTEGALNSKGYPIVDDISTWNIALQAAGFAPNDIANQYQQNEWITTRQRNVYEQKSSILTKYYFARLVGDFKEMQALQKEIKKFNSRKLVQEMGQAITSDTIQRSLKMRERKANEAIGGITIPDREREAIMRDLGYN